MAFIGPRSSFISVGVLDMRAQSRQATTRTLEHGSWQQMSYRSGPQCQPLTLCPTPDSMVFLTEADSESYSPLPWFEKIYLPHGAIRIDEGHMAIGTLHLGPHHDGAYISGADSIRLTGIIQQFATTTMDSSVPHPPRSLG